MVWKNGMISIECQNIQKNTNTWNFILFFFLWKEKISSTNDIYIYIYTWLYFHFYIVFNMKYLDWSRRRIVFSLTGRLLTRIRTQWRRSSPRASCQRAKLWLGLPPELPLPMPTWRRCAGDTLVLEFPAGLARIDAHTWRGLVHSHRSNQYAKGFLHSPGE